MKLTNNRNMKSDNFGILYKEILLMKNNNNNYNNSNNLLILKIHRDNIN